MEKKVCTICGLETSSLEKWGSCPKCEKTYCPECIDKSRKERGDLETLRSGNAYDKVAVVCPSCYSDLFRIY